jgi:tRNA C32,U32 (ribose-2'-O)-methylase TrmJ
MATMRSPNYPSLNLSQAVTALAKLYTAEKRTPVSHETAAAALGI